MCVCCWWCAQETLEYFANPDNLNSDVLPPGLSTWDPAPYLASAVPIAVSVVGVNFLHELGHRIAAFIRKVKLGPTYFIPNLQVRLIVLPVFMPVQCACCARHVSYGTVEWTCRQ